MSSFNHDQILSGNCEICSKKIFLLSRSTCHLCEKKFCPQCCLSSPFLPKISDNPFSRNKSCAVCTLVWLIPALEVDQMIKLPTKLILGVCKAYNVQLFASSEKMELVTELKKQKPNIRGLPRTYKDSWPQLSMRIKESRNLLPQIENALKHANMFSFNTNENDSMSEQNSSHLRKNAYQDAAQQQASHRTFSSEPSYRRNEYSTPNRTEPASNFGNERLGTSHDMFHNQSAPLRGRNYASESHDFNTRVTRPQSYRETFSQNTSAKSKHEVNPRDTKSTTQLKDYTIKELLAEKFPEHVAKSLPVSTLKRILRENFVSFDGVLEKSTLVQKVLVLLASFSEEKSKTAQTVSNATFEDHALSSGFEEDDRLCKICFEVNANCVLLECGHSISCVDCGKELLRLNQQCPICRTDIVRVVRIFK